MYKINECKNESEFYHQNSRFFHGNKIEFMNKEIVITKHAKKDNKTLTKNIPTQHNHLAEPIYKNSLSPHPFHSFRLVSMTLNYCRLCTGIWMIFEVLR